MAESRVRIAFLTDVPPGRSIELMLNLVAAHGVDRDEIVILHLLDENEEISDELIRASLPDIWRLLREDRPKLLVAMGMKVAKYFTPFRKLANAHAKFERIVLPKGFGLVPDDLADIETGATVSPGALLYQANTGLGNAQNEFIADLQAMWLHVNGLERDVRCDYGYLDSFEAIDEYLTHVEKLYATKQIPGCIVDVETNQHLDPFKKTAELVAIGFSHKSWFGRAVLIKHKDASLWQYPGMFEAFCVRLNKFFSRVRTGGWNYKFDVRWVRRHLGVQQFLKPFFDGHLAHNALFSELAPHDLKNSAIQITGSAIQEGDKDREIDRLRETYSDKPERWHMGWIDKAVLLNYLCGDVDKSFQCYEYLDPMIDDDHCHLSPEVLKRLGKGMSHRKAYEKLMLEAIVPFSEIEDNGLKVNRQMHTFLAREYPRRLTENLNPILATPWAQNLIAKLKLEAEQVAFEKEVDRVSRRNATEQKKAQDKPGYVPTVFTPRQIDLLKVEYKDPRQIVSYHVNLSRLLFDEAGIPARALGLEQKSKRGKGGEKVFYFSTRSAVLAKIIDWATLNGRPDLAKLATDIDHVKKDEKLFDSYIEKMPDYLDSDGLLHTTYNLTGARTGRCSTSDPPLHGMPTRDAETNPLAIIKMFESRWRKEGGLILAKDYSAMELRIVAAIAGDQGMIADFLAGVDPHKAAAAKIFHKELKDVTAEERRMAKTINFGVLYGMSEKGLAVRLGCSVEEARRLIAAFFAGRPDIAKWVAKQKHDMLRRVIVRPGSGQAVDNRRFNPDQRATKERLPHDYARMLVEDRQKLNSPRLWVDYSLDQHGYITTVFDRKRILKNAGHWDFGLASKAERQAVNTPIQSIASDVALAATIRIHNRLKDEGLKSKVFGFIHDSIKTDVYPGEFIPVNYIMKEEMEDRPKQLYKWLTLPVETSTEVGTGWGYHVDVAQMDFEKNICILKGDDTNLGLVERALSQHHEVTTLATEDVIDEKKGVVVAHKKTIQLYFKARTS